MLAILRRSAFSLAITLPLMAASSSLAFGQAQSINGSIRGVVTDTTGAPIAGAAVTIRNVDTGYVREVRRRRPLSRPRPANWQLLSLRFIDWLRASHTDRNSP